MILSFLLPLLLISTTVSAEVNCTGNHPRHVPSVASCDIALQHLARYLLPCLGRDTVKVGGYGGAPEADIRLPVIFADYTTYSRPTPACMIEVFWDGPEYGEESVKPGLLQTFVAGMKRQCIAAEPARFAQGMIEPRRQIFVKFEAAWVGGNLTAVGVNGTEMALDRPPVNPRDACRGPVEPLSDVNLNGPPPLVESS